MSNDEVPPINEDLYGVDRKRLYDDLEFDNLLKEAKIRDLLHREVGQRFKIKWIAIFVGLCVIVFMAITLMHMLHSVFWGPFIVVSPAFSVAMIVAPIVSITTITIALFVGAFRRFEDRDAERLGNGISGAANFVNGN